VLIFGLSLRDSCLSSHTFEEPFFRDFILFEMMYLYASFMHIIKLNLVWKLCINLS